MQSLRRRFSVPACIISLLCLLFVMHEVKAQTTNLNACDIIATQYAACKINPKPVPCPMPASVKIGQIACITQAGQLVSKVTSPIIAIRYGFDDGTVLYQNISTPTMTVMSPVIAAKFMDGKPHVITADAFSDPLTSKPFDRFFAFTFKKVP